MTNCEIQPVIFGRQPACALYFVCILYIGLKAVDNFPIIIFSSGRHAAAPSALLPYFPRHFPQEAHTTHKRGCDVSASYIYWYNSCLLFTSADA